MRVSEVRIKMTRGPGKLRAYCTITFDEMFVVRELRLIQGAHGYFLAMPSKKLQDHCPRCSSKNHLRARYCNNCGARLSEERGESDSRGRPKLHCDIAHPINQRCRQMVHNVVMAAYRREQEHIREAGNRPKEVWRFEELVDWIRDETMAEPEEMDESDDMTDETTDGADDAVL